MSWGWEGGEGLLRVVCGDALSLFQIKKKNHFPHPFSDLAPAVKKVDSATHGINLFPAERAIIGFPNTHPLDRDLSDG